MSSEIPAPGFDGISAHGFLSVLGAYPDVVASFYQDKVKGDNKYTQALHDDRWRYDDFPATIAMRPASKGLSKDELERLVKWKITHQTYRPFLLPQIRKNDPQTVEKCTAEARKILLSSKTSNANTHAGPSREILRKALDKVCELTGVGPATGTLILSVFDVQHIPFFEDELYAWLLPNHEGKLKYNAKEYFAMLDAFQASEIPELADPEVSLRPTGCYFEKVAFVCKHWNYVDEKYKTEILTPEKDNSMRPAHVYNGDDETSSANKSNGSPPPNQKGTAEVKNSSKKRKTVIHETQGSSLRRSKRNKT